MSLTRVLGAERSKLPLGEKGLPYHLETNGLMVFGLPSSGKSTFLQICNRDTILPGTHELYRAATVQTDPSGETAAQWRAQGVDFIDAHIRSQTGFAHNIAKEVAFDTEIEELARLYFPEDSSTSDPYWLDNAQLGFAGTGLYLTDTVGDDWCLADALNILFDDEDLPYCLSQLENPNRYSAEVFSRIGGDSRLAESALSVLRVGASKWARVAALSKVHFDAGRTYTTADVLDFSNKRLLIGLDAANPHLTKLQTGLILSRVGQELRSLNPEEGRSRRLYLAIDELASLSPDAAKELRNIQREGRKQGVVCIVATQSTKSVESMFQGNEVASAHDLLNIFGTVMSFRTSCPDTIDYLRRRFGKRYVDMVQSSRQYGPNGGSSESTSMQEVDFVTGEDLSSLHAPSAEEPFFEAVVSRQDSEQPVWIREPAGFYSGPNEPRRDLPASAEKLKPLTEDDRVRLRLPRRRMPDRGRIGGLFDDL